MKTFVFILATSLIGISAQAAPSKKAKSATKTNLSTEINFDDSVVRGKYQMADEGVATVENEKTLDDLLGLRKNFKDRLKLEEKRK